MKIKVLEACETNSTGQKSWESMPLEQYVVGDVIGKGSYGEVTLARHKKDKKQYVIKYIDLHNASTKERSFAQQEVEILSKLRHPNIVSYKESFQTDNGCLSIVMGFCEGGDLYNKLKKQAKAGDYLKETQIIEWFVQISMALQYMHDRNILHRDLKTQNIFLTKSKIIKLGDLGIARVLDSNIDMATTMIGTPYYMSPELFSNKPYNHKSDVWALGCCVYEMATLKHAFNAKDMNSLVYKILKGKTPAMPKHYSTELSEIIKSMLSYNPTQRPSASRILRLPFIKRHIAIFLEDTKNRRRSREEKPRLVASKCKNDSGTSESSILNNADSDGIATASKIEIGLAAENDSSEAINDKKPPLSSEHKKKRQRCAGNDQSSSTEKDDDRVSRNSSSHMRKNKCQENARQPTKEGEHPNVWRRNNLVEKKNASDETVQPVNQKLSSGNEQKRTERPLPKLNANVDGQPSKSQPRLPPPRFKKGLPETREVGDEKPVTPQSSPGVPNMAARRKRRQKQQEREQHRMSPPSLVKRSSDDLLPVLSYPSHTPRSSEEIIREEIQRRLHVNEEKDCVDGHPSSSSFPRDSSTGNIDSLSECEEPEKKGNDVSNLIVSLQATLKLDSKSQDRTSPTETAEIQDKALFPSASDRLKDRIEKLRSECISALGKVNVDKAFKIIDEYTEDHAEDALVELLGGEMFERYSGQIWQLKFCEEFKLDEK